MSIKELTTLGIDCDDTLWPLTGYYLEIKRSLARYIGQSSHIQCEEHAFNLLGQHMRQRIALQGVGYIMLEKSAIYALIEVKGSIDKQDIDFIKTECHKIPKLTLKPYDGVIKTLENLAKNYRLLALTKGHPGEQRPKFKNSGLEHFFDGLEIMYDKDIEHYEEVLSKNNIDKNTFCMIGNSLKSDILPVVELGAEAIHIPCRGHSWDYEMAHEDDIKGKTFHKIEKFSDLPKFLKTIR